MNATQLRELIESMTKSFEDIAKDIVKGKGSGSKETNYMKDELIEALVKQVQQLSVNYVAAISQQEWDTCDKEWHSKGTYRPKRDIVCYRCVEKGHMAPTCISETKYREPKEERRPTDNDQKVNYCDYKYDSNESEPLLIDVGGQLEPMELDEPWPVKQLRRKSGPSVVDNLVPYNIADDLLNTRANTTYGQMLQYPNQRQNLAQVMRQPLVALEPKKIRVP
ncbi:3738_t:CDS:2 [Cetraspora pellucida]|uniref:3738_t:CDS:1 n=1 Tax=Cetraspora pellucida TaxID=1433469 RepID=A0ACA9MBF2_9GLOM|nr:3738_t:CDS:2 [Cetraspora pellucida]